MKINENDMKPISMTTMKRRLIEHGAFPENVRNIRVNGVLHGCSGFAKGSSCYVYFTTEPPCMDFGFANGRCMMYRTAKDANDYCGGVNRWCRPEELVENVSNLANGRW